MPLSPTDPHPCAAQMEPGLIRLRAPNPSPMTQRGTNTYLLGTTSIAVIDPGPAHADHLAAILAACPAGGRITHILVTHAHLDHCALAVGLARHTRAPIIAFGDALSGRTPRMAALAGLAGIGGGEGVDTNFQPDQCLADGDSVSGSGWRLTALHTPGHFGNHLCFAWENRVFTGDHVMGWASSLISPPDGDLSAYRQSLARLQARKDRIYYPGHGDPVTTPDARLAFLVHHRQNRETAVMAALTGQFQPLTSLTGAVYHDTPQPLHTAATRNLLAHLIDLTDRNLVEADREFGHSARFRLAAAPPGRP